MRRWPRTANNDPYHAGSHAMADELRRATGLEVVVAFNEFCAPSVDEALDQAAGGGAEGVIVVTPMMTSGGEHSELDIPRAIERARGRHRDVRFTYAWPFASRDVAGFLAAHIARFADR
jgi:sirohydrochlorin cobaltochelatase